MQKMEIDVAQKKHVIYFLLANLALWHIAQAGNPPQLHIINTSNAPITFHEGMMNRNQQEVGPGSDFIKPLGWWSEIFHLHVYYKDEQQQWVLIPSQTCSIQSLKMDEGTCYKVIISMPSRESGAPTCYGSVLHKIGSLQNQTPRY